MSQIHRASSIPSPPKECGSDWTEERPTETLDEFMARHAESKAPNSILRIAWATGKPIQEVVDDLSR